MTLKLGHLIVWRPEWLPAGVRPLVVLLSLGGAVGFVHIASEILEGEGAGPDRAILLAFRTPGQLEKPIGPSWMLQSAIDLSALGGFTFIWLFTLATLGFLLMVRRWAAAGVFFLAIAGASVLNAVVKLGIHRSRPEVVPHLAEVSNASFPSGHAMISAATYMTVGALLAQTQSSTLVRTYLVTLSVGLALLIGVSRLFLGVHWPSDVLAGWLLGGAWALLFWTIAHQAERRMGATPPDRGAAIGAAAPV